MPSKKSRAVRKKPPEPRQPPRDGTVRITLSLDPDVVDDLIAMSEHLKITRSAFVSQTLRSMFVSMKRAIGDLPHDPQPSEIKRARGRSREEIAGMIDELTGALERLNTDDFNDNV